MKIIIGIIVIALIICYGIITTRESFKFYPPTIDDDWLLDRASELHDDQKYGDNPYVYHLERVLRNVKTYESFYGDDPELMRALEMSAIFHDTLEDVTGYTYNDLKKDARVVFSDEFYVNMVAEIVYACTNNKGRTRAERAGEEYYEGIRKTGYAPFVKACDRLANIEFAKSQGSSMYKKYIQEMPEFLKKIEEPGNLIPPKLKAELCAYLED